MSPTSPRPEAEPVVDPAAGPHDPPPRASRRERTRARGRKPSSPLEGPLVELAGELVAFLQHHTGDHHLGADLAQDVLARAFVALPSLRDPEALRGWVFRIAVNRFNDHVRRSRAVRVESGNVPERETAPSETPEGEALASEFDAVLRRELLALPERQRTVLMLHGVRGLDQRDIAELLGISVDAVKMSLFHAREKMRARLRRYVERVPTKRGG